MYVKLCLTPLPPHLIIFSVMFYAVYSRSELNPSYICMSFVLELHIILAQNWYTDTQGMGMWMRTRSSNASSTLDTTNKKERKQKYQRDWRQHYVTSVAVATAALAAKKKMWNRFSVNIKQINFISFKFNNILSEMKYKNAKVVCLAKRTECEWNFEIEHRRRRKKATTKINIINNKYFCRHTHTHIVTLNGII